VTQDVAVVHVRRPGIDVPVESDHAATARTMPTSRGLIEKRSAASSAAVIPARHLSSTARRPRRVRDRPSSGALTSWPNE
jgi:hypothetical protein